MDDSYQGPQPCHLPECDEGVFIACPSCDEFVCEDHVDDHRCGEEPGHGDHSPCRKKGSPSKSPKKTKKSGSSHKCSKHSKSSSSPEDYDLEDEAHRLILETRKRIAEGLKALQGYDTDTEELQFPPLPPSKRRSSHHEVHQGGSPSHTRSPPPKHPRRTPSRLPVMKDSPRPMKVGHCPQPGHRAARGSPARTRASPHKPLQEYVGTEEEIDELRSVSTPTFDVEQYLVDTIPPYEGQVEVEYETPPTGLRGVRSTSGPRRPRRKLFLARTTTRIVIPREKHGPGGSGKPLPERYVFEPGHPDHEVCPGELRPPRRYTPSPEPPYSQSEVPCQGEQLARRLALETPEERCQPYVASRVPRAESEERFGDLDCDPMDVHGMPERYRRAQGRTPLMMGDPARRLRR